MKKGKVKLLIALLCLLSSAGLLFAEGSTESVPTEVKPAGISADFKMLDPDEAPKPARFAAGNEKSGVAAALPNAEDMVIDPLNYYGQVVQGYYNFDCVVSVGVTRSAKFYIPAGSGLNQPTIFIMVPDDTDPYQFLIKSGWKDVADAKKLYMIMMEPEAGAWGSMEKELAYVNALRGDVSYRPFFTTFSSNFYALAYDRKTSDILLKNSVRAPRNWAGITLAGTDGISEDLVAEMQQTPSAVSGVMMSQVLMPIWIVSDKKTADVERLIDYYRAANHSAYISTDTSYADEVYLPREDGGTADNEWCARVVYSQSSTEACLNADFAASVYDNLLDGVLRYPGDSNGALRQNDSFTARGIQKFSALVPGGFKEDKRDVYQREWWVYVPNSVDRSKPAPLVFCFHGAGGSGNEMPDRSGWASVAEEKGFILISPTGSHIVKVRNVSDMTTNELFRPWWNLAGDATETQPSDTLFVRYLLDWARNNYNIDETRVYGSGQSLGGMMSWRSALDLADIFAAVAPVSANGTMNDLPQHMGGDLKMPIIAFIGYLDRGFGGGFNTDAARATIEYWTERNGTVEQWSDFTWGNNGSGATYKTDNFNSYVLNTGAGVPIMRMVEVEEKTHAILPSECFIAWNECFSHYTRDPKTGDLYYDGALVK